MSETVAIITVPRPDAGRRPVTAALCVICKRREATKLVRHAFADDCDHRYDWCEGCALPACAECAQEVIDWDTGDVRQLDDERMRA